MWDQLIINRDFISEKRPLRYHYVKDQKDYVYNIYIDIHNDILHVPGTKHCNLIFFVGPPSITGSPKLMGK